MSHLIALIFVLASAYIGSAIFSLLLGIILAYCIKLPDNFITKKIGSKFIQIGIILLAFSIPIYDAFEITKLLIPSIAPYKLIKLDSSPPSGILYAGSSTLTTDNPGVENL